MGRLQCWIAGFPDCLRNGFGYREVLTRGSRRIASQCETRTAGVNHRFIVHEAAGRKLAPITILEAKCVIKPESDIDVARLCLLKDRAHVFSHPSQLTHSHQIFGSKVTSRPTALNSSDRRRAICLRFRPRFASVTCLAISSSFCCNCIRSPAGRQVANVANYDRQHSARKGGNSAVH